MMLYASAFALLFGVLYFQTGQGPLQALLWLLLRLRAAAILTAWTVRHAAWWANAHWQHALSDARREQRVIVVEREAEPTLWERFVG